MEITKVNNSAIMSARDLTRGSCLVDMNLLEDKNLNSFISTLGKTDNIACQCNSCDSEMIGPQCSLGGLDTGLLVVSEGLNNCSFFVCYKPGGPQFSYVDFQLCSAKAKSLG